MAANEGILIQLDISEITADVIATVVRRVIQVLEYKTLTLAHNASYSLGTSTNEVTASVGAGGTVTADYGIRVQMDSTLSDDAKSEILRKVLQVLEPHTVALTHAASYAAGNGTFQVEIDVI